MSKFFKGLAIPALVVGTIASFPTPADAQLSKNEIIVKKCQANSNSGTLFVIKSVDEKNRTFYDYTFDKKRRDSIVKENKSWGDSVTIEEVRCDAAKL